MMLMMGSKAWLDLVFENICQLERAGEIEDKSL